MSFSKMDNEIADFKRRIVETINLNDDPDSLVECMKSVALWSQNQLKKIKQAKQIREKKKSNIMGNLFGRSSKEQTQLQIQTKFIQLSNLQKFIKEGIIPQNFNLNSFELANTLKNSFSMIKNKNINMNYYGRAKGPFVSNKLILKKDDLHTKIKEKIVNSIKFGIIKEQQCDKYQRNLVQQIFGRVFRQNGSFSVVIKIQIQNGIFQSPSPLFCYLQDLKFRQQIIWKSIGNLATNDAQIFIDYQNKRYQIQQKNILSTYLSEILVVPLQTLVSQYVVQIKDEYAFLIKHHDLEQNQLNQSNLKEHPSIRNPLFYFKQYNSNHQINLNLVKQVVVSYQLYGKFYKSLDMIIELLIQDYTFQVQKSKRKSLRFGVKTFKLLWNSFHKIGLLSSWIEEVIKPIKDHVTIAQIFSRVCPIFNSMSNFQAANITQFKNILLGLQIESFITTCIPKSTLQIYKKILSGPNDDCTSNYFDLQEIYHSIILPVLQEVNLKYIDPFQAAYILNLISKYKGKSKKFPPQWLNKKLWITIYKSIQNQKNSYLDFHLDMLGYQNQIETFYLTQKPFFLFQKQVQSDRFMQKFKQFTNLIRLKYPKNFDKIMSLLLQKAFKFNKLRIVEWLLTQEIKIQDYNDIFDCQKGTEQQSRKKEKILQQMKVKCPQMHRRYRWEELMRVSLKYYQQGFKKIQTLQYGECWISQQNQKLLSNQDQSTLQLNVSRKDYKYGISRQVVKISLSASIQFYIQKSPYPMVPQFYKIVLKKFGLGHLLPNYTLFFTDKGVYQLTEALPKAITFQRALNHFTQNQIKYQFQEGLLSQGILISMILLPNKLTLKDLIICPESQGRGLFLINFSQFYQAYPIIKQGGSYVLNCKNCLFAMDIMQKQISTQLIKKYYQIDVLSFVTELFKYLPDITKKAIEIRKKFLSSNEKQLLGIIFQQDFILALTERMFIIKRQFQNCIKRNTNMNFMRLLQKISPECSYFYHEIITSSNSLLEREKNLFDEMWTKPFIKSQNLLNFVAHSSLSHQPLNKFPNHYYKFCFYGPSQSLIYFSQNINRFQIFNSEFHQSKQNWMIFPNKVLQYYMFYVDFKNHTQQQKDTFYETIANKSTEYLKQGSNLLPFNHIKFKSLQLVKDAKSFLQSFSYERVKQLVFEDCKISVSKLTFLSSKMDNVTYLCLKNIQGLQYIGASSITSSATLQLKNVTTLIVEECHDVMYIDIKCDILENVVVRNNRQLHNIFISSFYLKNMNCIQNPKLNIENIGIYILKGINVLLCKSTSFGDAFKLYDDNYGIYLTKLLRFIIHRFQETPSKNNILLTLSKIDPIEENSTQYIASSGIFSGLSNIAFKLSSTLQNKILIKLTQLFLQNQHIDKLFISHLINNNSNKIFTYIGDAISASKNKIISFKEVYIERPTFSGLPQLIKIFPLLKFQKSVTFFIENLTQQNQTDDQNLLLKQFTHSHQQIQKLCISIKHSKLTSKFIASIFDCKQQHQRSNQHPKVTKLYMQDTFLGFNAIEFTQFKGLKQLSFVKCQINNFKILKSLKSLHRLTISNTIIGCSARQFYDHLQCLQNLNSLNFNQQTQKIKQFNIDQFIQILYKLKNLQQLDLSDNQVKPSQIKSINEFLRNIQIDSFTLNNFYFKNQLGNYNFSQFLKKSSLKYLQIQFKTQGHLYQFLQSISNNKKLIKLTLKVNFVISSQILKPLNLNDTLEDIKCNELLPMWLKNHLNQSSIKKSKIYNLHQEVSFPSKVIDYYKIGLSLDGGGTRGILIASHLDYIQTKVGYPICKIFDYVGGTSIGGILALGVTGTLDSQNPICYAKDLVQIFQKYGKTIFKKTQIQSITNIFDTKYNSSGIQSVLKNYFKNCKLSSVMQQTNVLITAVSRIDNRDVIFKSTEAILHRDKDFFMKDVGRATSAAPTYFSSAEIKNIDATVKLSLMDGGVGMNNPSKLVIDEVRKMAFNYGCDNNYFLLSLGTGRLKAETIPQHAGLRHIAPIVDSFTESANFFAQRDLQDNYKGHYLRVSPEIALERKQVQLDNAQQETLKFYKDLAYESAKKHFSNTIYFGKYRNLSFIDWLRENTQKKYDL